MTHLDDERVDYEINLYDHYFDRTFVSNDYCINNDILDDINTSTENMEENDVRNTENDGEDIDEVHVDDNDVNIHHISVAHDIDTHVQANNDTYSFTDGSSLFIGQRFSSKTEIKKVLSKIALGSSFESESVKSSRNIYSVRCVNKGCSWRIWTSKHENSTDFVIRTYCNTHNCDLTGMRRRHRQGSSSIVCDMLVENFGGQQKTPQPKSIMTMMRNKGVDITYYKALKGKQLAHDIFRGDPERSFGLLPSYLKMVERMNPGSIIDLVVDEHNRFKYLFLAYGACARGYRCMRKVVSIDGTWLKGKYDGTLLVASAQDGDFHQYPLAWNVVDVESIASWSWFLTKLLEVVVDEEELVIISDRHPGIIAAVAAVYKNAHNGHCIWHLSQNMKIRCKKKGCTEMFMRLAKIYKQTDFDLEYEKFKKIYLDAAKFLDESDSFDRWTRAYSPRSRYNIMTTNGVESINARLREERQLPIIALLNSLQTLTTSWFSRYRNASVASTTNFTPTVESIVRERFNIGRGYQVYELGRLEFDVRSATNNEIVDLESKRCTCREFDIDKIPCSHAIAASYFCDVNFYSLCTEYYSVMIWSLAYSEPIYPVLNQNEWPLDDLLVLLPVIKRRRGRKKQNRFPSVGEFGRRYD
ncbi:uncharacterized protein [Primulina eburnea]|uniref:uncharacterized protein n=1 Tax=Primulina eburnea TaxID=1245227 RepID=UPI003C6CB101